MSHDCGMTWVGGPYVSKWPFVLGRASEVHACTSTVHSNKAVQLPKLRTAYIYWVNLMMTSLHSYAAFFLYTYWEAESTRAQKYRECACVFLCVLRGQS
ncbi:hypothetical protein V496_09954 [Pseudogymnoascus sp. VKM F-4515 (FW-2607)]|nr:hypothetical protein V496_09954 [Pseudogymnoascus sp. VKM F-4515 (FW-2607)]